MRGKVGLKSVIRKSEGGFTLVELLVVVSLVVIIVGVAGDIIITVVRSYNKTQIANEVEQNVNFVFNKLEKELRNATEVTNFGNKELEFTQILSSGLVKVIEYKIVDAKDEFGAVDGVYAMARRVDGGSWESLTNYNSPIGVTVDYGGTHFQNLSAAGGPDVVKIVLEVSNIGGSYVPVQFRQSTVLEKTIVIRGSY